MNSQMFGFFIVMLVALARESAVTVVEIEPKGREKIAISRRMPSRTTMVCANNRLVFRVEMIVVAGMPIVHTQTAALALLMADKVISIGSANIQMSVEARMGVEPPLSTTVQRWLAMLLAMAR